MLSPIWNIHLERKSTVAVHTNDEVDVVMTILSGGGLAFVNSEPHVLVTGQILVIPKGISREIKANSEGITYLNVHKRRKKLLPNMVRPRNQNPKL